MGGEQSHLPDPLAQTSMPDSTSTMAARRNKVCLSAERLNQWEWLESKIRSKVQKHRVNLLPSFKDMDRSNCGHITKNQFFRAMSDGAPYKGKSPFTMLSVEECVATVAKQVLGPLGVEEVRQCPVRSGAGEEDEEEEEKEEDAGSSDKI
eukprot:s1362_g4.t2